MKRAVRYKITKVGPSSLWCARTKRHIAGSSTRRQDSRLILTIARRTLHRVEEMPQHRPSAEKTDESLQGPAEAVRFGHQSALPLLLYLLSFAPPIPPPWQLLRSFIRHPWVLYSIGVVVMFASSATQPVAQWLRGVY